MRKTIFANGEYYHIYNRGVDKRAIVSDEYDSQRFLESIMFFNTENPIGSLYENSFVDKSIKHIKKPLVKIICYCLNQNNYHMILQQNSERGVEQFMHRLSTGYTKYFNQKYKRSGSLFQGPYKAIHIDSNEYLLYLSAYVNLNNKIHQLGSLASKLVRSSWDEYQNVLWKNNEQICDTKIILSQFNSKKEYVSFAREAMNIIKNNKEKKKELTEILIEN